MWRVPIVPTDCRACAPRPTYGLSGEQEREEVGRSGDFLDKLANIGYDFSDELGNKKYNVANLEYYLVDDKFPALRETDIKSDAINNVGYELILKLLNDYLVK